MSSASDGSTPTITAPLDRLTLTLGSAIAPITIATTGGTPTGFAADALPPGLALARSTGVITGTPSRPGAYTVALLASNPAGTGSATLQLLVLGEPPGAPRFLPFAHLLSGTVGAAMAVTLGATGATRYEIDLLPPGLSLAADTGTISGTPTASSTLSSVLFAIGSGGASATQLDFRITAGSPPVFGEISDPLTGSVGVPMTVDASARYALSYAVDALPEGLVLGGGGVITGTPRRAQSLTSTLTAVGYGGTSTRSIRFVIAPAAVTPPDSTSSDSSSRCLLGGNLALLALVLGGLVLRARRGT
jgi:PKD repeat protein